MTIDQFTVPALAGVVAPFVIAVLNRVGWSAKAKTSVAGIFYAVVTAGVLFAQSYPAKWQAVAGVLLTVAIAGQTAFSALKPSGILDGIERAINPGKRPGDIEPRTLGE